MDRLAHRRLRTGLALVLALAAFDARPAGAATAAAAARKAANAATNDALATYRTQEQQARAQLDDDLADLEGTIVGSVNVLAVVQSLVEILSALQGALTTAQDGALDQGAAGHATAMTEFATATDSGEPFPRDLLAGGGGAADRLRDGLRAAAEKSAAKVRKRLARTARAMNAADVRVVIRVAAPRPTHEQAPNNAGTIPVGETPLTIDVLIAASSSPALEGGFVVATGQSEADLGAVAVALDGSDGQANAALPSILADRWSIILGVPDLVDAGNEIMTVRQGTGALVTAPIGVP